MPDQRIKGQEINILITAGGTLEDTLTDIQNFNMEVDLEIRKQGYLGEKTDRRDEVYNGVKFDLELHIHKAAWFAFVRKIIDRAKRDTPDVVFNITGVFNFPNGETPQLLLPDVKWGAIPHNVSARGDFVKVKLQGECEDFEVQT